jgi:UDP-N-acetylglucosamine acyltransferase
VNIHPQAIVSPQAKLGRDVVVGPFSIIESDVELGDGCELAAGVVIKDGTKLGSGNRILEGSVIGGLAQHTRIPERIGRIVIGDNNTIREHCTIHRALHEGASTIVGNNNLLMVCAHIAHDCHVGNNVIFANNTLLAGHVSVEDRAFLSGAVGVHQFCRVGRLAMIGGHARVVQDVPPYVMVDGISGCIVGLNLVGLRRNGFVAEEIADLKAAYRLIYRSGLPWHEILNQLQLDFSHGPAAEFHTFLSQGKRGFVQERRMPPTATLKLRRPADDEEQADETQKKAAG